MKLPLVAIVGRPNVGKSTLFNRLLGKRDAIVDDVSGVTRDRNYGESDWSGKKFRLIDTGGYVPESSDLFESAIREQVETAIDEADSIIFLLDFKAGLNPIDKIIANMLRQSGKKYFVVINKVDNEIQKQALSEFYEIGVDKIYNISALSGRQLGDLLDDITSDFPEIDETLQDPRLKIAIVGRPNVGKSSLANALLGQERSIVTDIPGTTRDSIDSILKYYGEEIILIDTAGLRKKSKVQESIEFFSNIRTYKAIGECDVAIVMIDAKLGFESQDQKIIDEVIRWRKGLIIAVNKWDLIEKDQNTALQFERAIRNKLGTADFAPIIFISALTKQRIFKLIELSKQVESERKKKIPTSQLNDEILPEIEKNPPPATKTGREVKIKYITQVGTHYPIFLFFTNYPNQVADHYKRFLENLLRRKYGFEGVPLTLSFKSKSKEFK
ncbi:Putative GTPase [Ignavibacterium album JCM 16511]|uniref:GTPase Der n=1 Tax=Ignavibacterium album (strain DSM 19864 / JCM 16511 / NBRC 101810 / Mat9-16) TaxID=945713 RepID=I0AJC8_IGNAJ|nr:ribosome biogenesis GTPase Der [Ignavibacterium album]AFH49085.1 Putative GTPase [Ignavibacterium album JCM 16511]